MVSRNTEFTFEYDDIMSTVAIKDSEGTLVGEFTFQVEDDAIRVTNMKIDASYRNKGLGREALKEAALDSDLPVVFTPIGSSMMDDGSHLVEQGPGFAQRMVDEGLAYFD